MRPTLLPVLFVIFGIAVLRASAGTLSIDGVSVGPVRKWSGGDARGEVIADASGGKHLGQPSYDPVVVEVPLPLAAPLMGWINDFASDKHTTKNLVLTATDPRAYTTVTTLEAGDAYLTSVRFPIGDTARPEGATVVLVFGVGQTRLATLTGQSTTSAAARTAAYVQHFRLKVDGLDASRVSALESIEMKLASAASQPGDARLATTPTGSTVLSNLIVTMPESAAATWKTWFTDFAINGNNDSTREKGGSLEFLDPTLTTVALRLQFSQMGIMRVTRQPPAEAATTVQAELYFEQLSIATLPAAATQTSQTPPTDPTPAQPAATPPTTTPPPPTTTTAPASATDALIGSTRVPVTATSTGDTQIRSLTTTLPQTNTLTVAQPVPSSSTMAAVQEGTNPADQGSRDPIEFPRIGGLTRLTFSGSMQKNYVQESATYASADELRRVVDSVTTTAKAAGWQQTSLSESGDKTIGRLVNAEWSKGTIRAQLSITDRKPNGTTITLWVAGVKSGG